MNLFAWAGKGLNYLVQAAALPPLRLAEEHDLEPEAFPAPRTSGMYSIIGDQVTEINLSTCDVPDMVTRFLMTIMLRQRGSVERLAKISRKFTLHDLLVEAGITPYGEVMWCLANQRLKAQFEGHRVALPSEFRIDTVQFTPEEMVTLGEEPTPFKGRVVVEYLYTPGERCFDPELQNKTLRVTFRIFGTGTSSGMFDIDNYGKAYMEYVG